MPTARYSNVPTPSTRTSAAVSRSSRAARASTPKSRPVQAQTAMKTTRGNPALPASSSSGSASGNDGPSRPTCGLAMYSQPVAASSTSSPVNVSPTLRNALAMSEVCGGDLDGDPGVVAPDPPGVAAVTDEEPVRDAVAGQLRGEAPVLAPVPVGAARVEPDERVLAPELRSDLRQRQRRAVPRQEIGTAAEDRRDVVRLLVAGPALEHAELGRVVEPDVERGVAALGETAERARRAVRDRSEPAVDGPDDVPREERLPATVAEDAVRPLLVREDPGRAHRHRDDRRLHLLLGEQRVLDDPDADGADEALRVAREAVQQVEHRVALGALCVARRQVDD